METHDRLSSDGLVHDKQRLSELQALPLDRKIGITQARIMEWYLHYGGNVYVSFSGGKDSTVLLHIARQLFPDIPAVYVDTGLEFPEVKRFIRSFDHVNIIRPKMTFPEVISFYGYPLIGKEVAEAIYYARRHDYGEREREREREAAEEKEQNHHWNAYEGWGNSSGRISCSIKTRTRKLKELCGLRNGGDG